MISSTSRALDRVALLFLVFGVPLFFPGLLAGRLPGPFAAGVSDTFVFFEPYALEFTRALRSGSNPFWSYTSAFGAPTLLTLGTGALHPFHLLHLLAPDWLAFALGWWLRMALFSAYFHAYLRLLGVRPWVALSFALTMTYGSFFINYSHEIIGYVVAFFPMALFHGTRVCRHPRAVDIILFAAAVAALLLGGFPSVILYLLLVLGAYLLVTATNRRLLAVALLACGAGVLLAWPAVVETLGFYPSTGYSPEQRRLLFFYDPPAVTALNLVFPSIFGNMHGYRDAGMRDFYGSLLGAGVLTIPLLVVLSVRAAVRKMAIDVPTAFWLAVFLLSTVAYFNLFHVKQIIQYIPVINEHPLTRLQTLITLAASISAALLLERTLRTACTKDWMCMLGAIGALLLAAYVYAMQRMVGGSVAFNGAMYGAIAILSLAALAWVVHGGGGPARIAFVVGAAVLGIATSFSYTYYYTPGEYYPKNALIEHIEQHLLPGARILDVQNVLFRNTAIAYGIPSLTNHWFSPPALRSKVHEASRDPPGTGLTLDVINSIDPERAWGVLRQMHAQFVSLPCTDGRQWMDAPRSGPTGPLWRSIPLRHEGVCLVEVLWHGMPLGMQEGIPGDGYRGYREDAGGIRFQATRASFTIPVRYHDGWRVTSGNAKAVRTSDGWIGINANGVVQEIRLEYFPRNLLLWLLLGPTVLVLAIVAGSHAARPRQVAERCH